MEPGLQQEEPSCVPPPQICKGEEISSGQAGFELVISCEAQGKNLIKSDAVTVALGPPHTSPLCLWLQPKNPGTATW